MPTVLKSGSLHFLEPSGPVQAFNGIALPLPLPFTILPLHFMFFNMLYQHTDMRRLTTELRSENCVVRRFRRCANVIQYTYTNLDIIAYYTLRL